MPICNDTNDKLSVIAQNLQKLALNNNLSATAQTALNAQLTQLQALIAKNKASDCGCGSK